MAQAVQLLTGSERKAAAPKAKSRKAVEIAGVFELAEGKETNGGRMKYTGRTEDGWLVLVYVPEDATRKHLSFGATSYDSQS